MKKLISLLAKSLLFGLVLLVPMALKAKKIDDDHYQFCVMDDGDICDAEYGDALDVHMVANLGDKWYSINVEVVDNLDPIAIELNKKEVTLNVGESFDLNATLSPADARTSVTWISSDESVVLVNNGKITGNGRGNAVIEVSTSNGLSERCYVTVLGDEDYHHIKIGDLYYDLNRNDMTAKVVHAIDFKGDEYFSDYTEEEYNYIQGAVEIPSSVTWYDREFKVTEIGNFAFLVCGIKSIELPNTLVTIGSRAFYRTLLTDVMIPEGVYSIGNSCFMDSSLENISLPNTLKVIEGSCFYRLSNLLDIQLPSSLETIGVYAFSESGIKSIVIPKGVKTIGRGAFGECENLKAIYVDSNNPNFIVYKDCLYTKDLKKLVCAPITLHEIIFPIEAEEISEQASLHNLNMESLVLSDNITFVKSGAFSECKNLKQIVFNESLQTIEDWAFQDCSSLTKLNLPESLLEIGEDAFSGCTDVKEISLGSKLKIIGESAFEDVKAEKIKINALMPPTIEESTFSDYEARLIVPKGRTEAYSKAKGWKNFKNISDEDIDDEDDAVDTVVADSNDNGIEIYDLNGAFVSSSTDNLAPGIYIVRRGNAIEKIAVK